MKEKFMRRVALPLPAAALAASKAYRTGKFVSGSWTGFSSRFDILMVGTDNTIPVDAGIRSRYPSENPEVICFSFSSGTVAVKNFAGLDFTVFSKQGSHRALSGPSGASVFVAAATTEPRALGLVGTGLLGLAGLARRTLKAPT